MSGGLFTRKQVFPDSRGVFAPLSLKVGGLDWIQSNVSFNPKIAITTNAAVSKNEYFPINLTNH